MKTLKLLIVILALQSCSTKNQKKESDLINVTAMKVASSKENYELSFSGQLKSEDKATLSFLVGGMVSELHVTEGQSVKKGQLLATLQPTDYINENALREATLMDAEDTYNRMKGLYEKNSVPERDFVRAKSSYLRARAGNDIAKKKLADTKLFAPFDGTIFNKVVRKGVVVNPGEPIYEIATIDKLEVVVAVPESEINSVKIGDVLNTKVYSLPQYSFEAKITNIISVADAATRSYKVKAKIQNKDNILKDGMLAEVLITTGEKAQYLNVPGNAIVMGADGISHIYVYDSGTERALKTRVTTEGVRGNMVIIKEGLKGNELIITQGQHQLRDGTQVKLINEASVATNSL